MFNQQLPCYTQRVVETLKDFLMLSMFYVSEVGIHEMLSLIERLYFIFFCSLCDSRKC